MSFDLSVWHSDVELSDDEAGKIHLNLCKNWPYLEGEHPSVTAFYDELTQKWPEIDTIPRERIDDFDFCPWSCAHSHSEMAVVMCCVWSMADKVADFVEDLADKHGLVCFDPQAGRVILPTELLEKKRNLIASAGQSIPNAGLFRRLFGRQKRP